MRVLVAWKHPPQMQIMCAIFQAIFVSVVFRHRLKSCHSLKPFKENSLEQNENTGRTAWALCFSMIHLTWD